MTAEAGTAYRWTRERYDHAVRAGVFDDARVELLDGEIVDRPPQSSQHAGATRRLRNRLIRELDPVTWLVGGQDPVALSTWSEPEPDVWVARIVDAASGEHPTPDVLSLVVEVSWSSRLHDRVLKLPLYARAGVPEYWIVDLTTATVDVHRRPIGDRYTEVVTHRAGDVLTVPGTDLTVDVTALLGG